MHTIHSDGHWLPADLFDHLAQEQFRLVAVTDHDRVDTVTEMQTLGAARGIIVIPGVEVTTDWEGQMAHLLCYGFDAPQGALASLTEQIRAGQLANARAVNAALQQQGYAFPQQATILADKGGEINHPLDNVVLLREHGYAADFREGVRMAVAAGHRTVAAPLAEAVAAAHADGGVALIAHPGRREEGFTFYDPPLLDRVRATGLPLDGIEVYYPLYTQEQTDAYVAYVTEHGWLASSGSDSHGPRQRFPIPYAAQQISRLLERLGLQVQP